MIILTSNGLTSDAVRDKFTVLLKKGLDKVALVITADPQYREQNRKAISTKETFDKLGFETDFFDIEYSEPNLLLEYDIIYFNGGNPFYLLNQVRNTGTDLIIKELLNKGKVLSGSSAGSIIMGETIALISEFDPQLNNTAQLIDLNGLAITHINLCPHYSRYKNYYKNFENRIYQFEKKTGHAITRIDDGQAIVIKQDKHIVI